MAREDRDAPDAVDDDPRAGPPPLPPGAAELFARLEAEPWSFHLYQALRRIECLYPDLPRMGRAQRLRDDPVRLGQEPTLAFAPSTLSSFTPSERGGRPRLDQYMFGVFGPNGPLPLHLTDYARERERNHGDHTLRRFVDLFHHRLLQLFYRAWADANPAVCYDRPAEDRFGSHLACLVGMGGDALRRRGDLPDAVWRHWAGLFASPARHAEGLERVLSGFFRMPVRVAANHGHWLEVPHDRRSRLGGMECRLGHSATLGERVWDAAGRFRLVFGPVSRAEFERLLPGSASLGRLHALVRAWCGEELSWDVNVILRRDEVPGTRLGREGHLGWTSWTLGGPATADARDYIIEPAALAARP
jgi:type VI secretion system protein ImpH